MTSIFLHDYVEQVNRLIDNNRLVEAIEHCRHILHQYPRHIDTYRVMGKALLEKQDYGAATDLFLRILSTDPNDFISHVGLSIIYKEESQYDQALWHLERAYEIQPYNVAIQGELRQLYAVETETRPGILPLTRGALARLYMQGELYQQAISELRRILAEEPDRVDLQVLLAEALWRDDQRIDAEEVCLNVLEELPNCIVLNAILSEIWLQTGRIPEAQKYLQRLHALTWQTKQFLDRDSIAGQAFATEGAFQLPDVAALEYLETGTDITELPATPSDDWVEEVTFDAPGEAEDALGEVVLEPESGMHSYDWLADIQESGDGETAVAEQVGSEADWFSQESAKDDLKLATGELDAEWLADLRGDAEESDFQPLELETPPGHEVEDEDGASDWFAAEDELPDVPTEEVSEAPDDTAVSLPDDETDRVNDQDWLEALAEVEGESDASSLEFDATSLMDDELLDWAEAESGPHIVQEPKTPFWLSEMADEEMDAVQLNPEEALDWLSELPEEVGEAEPDAPADELEAEAEAAEAPEAELVDAAEDLDWLSDVPAETTVIDVPEEAEEDEIGPTAVLDPEEQAEDAEIKVALDTDALGDADDWLAALTEGSIEEQIEWDDDQAGEKADEIELAASTEEFSALSDADDWLESAAVDLDAIFEATETEEDEFPNLSIPEIEGAEISESDIPDWLDNEDVDLSEESEAAVSSENDPQEAPQPEEPKMEAAGASDEEETLEDALDWLEDLASDAPAADEKRTDVPLEPPIETEGMPSWLEEANQQSDVEVVDEWESESANIPEWLQEPVPLSDLDDDTVLGEEGEAETTGLTGLLSEMEVDAPEAAVPLDDMDSLLSDWVDEDADGSLSELLGDIDMPEAEADAASPADLTFDAPELETAVADEPETPEEPAEEGLTGLLSKLSVEEDLPTGPEDEADILSEALAGAEDDDLSGLLWDDMPEPEAEPSDAVDLGDLENVSLTEMLSDIDVEEASGPEFGAVDDEVDDWLSDLSDMSDEQEAPEAEPEEEIGLTGMLANLQIDEAEEAVEAELLETAVPEVDDPLADLEGTSVDDLGLTELLAGIDYAEDAIDSEPNLPELDLGQAEPSLTEILSDMEEPPEAEPEEEPRFISAEDTTWLDQLEADTGGLQEETDDFDMEETGLDWLTSPDEPEEAEPEPPAASDEAEVEPEASKEADSTPEDWDDPMSWLEELAAQKEGPVGELPSVAETMLDEELDPAILPDDAPLMTDESTDWLDELTGDTGQLSDLSMTEMGESPAEEMADEPADLLLPEAEAALSADELEDLADDEALSWLDELTTDRLPETAVEEAETVIESDEPEPLAVESGDAAWLDELMAEDDADDETADDMLPEADLLGDALEGLAPDLPETSVGDSDLDWLDTALDETEAAAEPETVEPAEMEAAERPDEAEAEETYQVTGVTDALKADDGIEEAEADLEEALAWLDELDEEPEAEHVDEAPPTIITPPEAHELDQQFDDEPETVVVTPEPDALTLALNRLEQQVQDEGIDIPDTPAAPLSLSTDALNAALDWIEQAETTREAPPVEQVEEVEDAVEEPVPVDVTVAAEPVETAVASEVEAAADELVLDDTTDEDDLAQMADDPEAWLEQMLSDDAALDVDMEPPPIKPSEDAVFVIDDAPGAEPEAADIEPDADEEPEAEAIDSLLDEVVLDGLPDDPDAAVAWLDQMVSGDDALDIEMEPPPIRPSEDAVYTTEDAEAEAEPDILDEAPIPEEAAVEEDELAGLEDDPEAWLEQMLSGDMALDVDMEPPPIKPSEDAVFVTDDAPQAEIEPELEVEDAAAEAAEAEIDEAEPVAEAPDVALEEDDTVGEEAAEIGDIDMSEDPEAWLEQMLSDDLDMAVEMEPPPIKPSDDAVYVTDDGRTEEPDQLDAAEMDEAATEEIETDIIAEVPDDPDEAMAWLEDLAAQQGASIEELPTVTDADAESEMPDWMADDLAELAAEPDLERVDESAAAGESLTETAVAAELTDTDTLDDDVDAEMPDWLDEDEGMMGQTGWLRSLPEVDMETWLSAEDEATASGPLEEAPPPETGPHRPTFDAEPEPEQLDELFEPVLEPSTGAYSVDEAKLNVAQESLADGRIDDALTQFKELVSEGAGMMTIIAELEQAADAHPQTPALFQVLGDAYMRNGQLQKALASYRSALNQM